MTERKQRETMCRYLHLQKIVINKSALFTAYQVFLFCFFFACFLKHPQYLVPLFLIYILSTFQNAGAFTYSHLYVDGTIIT